MKRIVTMAAATTGLLLGAVVVPVASASAATASGAATLPSRTLQIKSGGQVATVVLRGNWKLSKAKVPREHLPSVKPGTASAKPGNANYSNNWSGYALVPTGTDTFTRVTASFNVPNLNCANSTPGSDGSWYSDWTGIDGWNDGTVEQQGTEAYCSGGSQGLYVFYEMYPASPVVFTGADPGDALVATTSYSAKSKKYTLSVKDVTQNQAGVTETIACSATCSNTSAEVVSEAPGGGPPAYGLADFGAESYTNVSVTGGGVTGGLKSNAEWTHIPITMDNGGTNLAVPGSLQGSSAFIDHWENAL